MSRSFKPILIVGLAVEVITASTYAQNKVWDGGAGTLSWHDANNWNPNGVPGVGDDVLIDVPGVIAVSFTGGTTSINSLTCREKLTLSNGTLSIDAASQIDDDFTMSGGTIDGAGMLLITKFCNWTGGNLHGPGEFHIAPGATLDMGGNGVKWFTRPIMNYGLINWLGGNVVAGADIHCLAPPPGMKRSGTDSVSFAIRPDGGRFSASSPYKVYAGSDCQVDSAGSCDVDKLRSMPSPNGLLDGDPPIEFHIPVVLGPYGRLEVMRDIALPAGSSLGAGSQVIVDMGMELHVPNAVLIDPSTSISGEGSVSLNGGTFSFAPNMLSIVHVTAYATSLTLNNPQSVGNLTTSNGSVTLVGPGTFANIITTSGFLTCNGPQTIANLIFDGGVLDGPGDVVITGTATWDADGGSSEMSGSGKTIIAPSATMNIVAGLGRFLKRTIENHGTVNLNPSQINHTNGVWNNAVDGVVNVYAINNIFANFGGNNAFNNAGTLNKGAAGTGQCGIPLNNSGAVIVGQGTMEFAGGVVQYSGATNTLTGGQWRIAPGATLSLFGGPGIRTLAAGASVQMDGPGSTFAEVAGLTTINSGASFELAGGRDFVATPTGGTFTNNGTLTLGADCGLSINGAYSQGVGAALNVAFDATPEAAVTTTGNTTLDGALAVTVQPPPTTTTPLTILSSSGGRVSGVFEVTDLPRGQLTYGASNVTFNAFRAGDVDGNGQVDTDDLLLLLGQWGGCPVPPLACPADLDDNGSVDTDDLLLLLGNWG